MKRGYVFQVAKAMQFVQEVARIMSWSKFSLRNSWRWEYDEVEIYISEEDADK